MVDTFASTEQYRRAKDEILKLVETRTVKVILSTDPLKDPGAIARAQGELEGARRVFAMLDQWGKEETHGYP